MYHNNYKYKKIYQNMLYIYIYIYIYIIVYKLVLTKIYFISIINFSYNYQ